MVRGGIEIKYSDAFCKIYNELGWNFYPEAFAKELLEWLRINKPDVKNSLDLACGTGVLCHALHQSGICADGVDLSDGMIEIARARCPDSHFEVCDMRDYIPDKTYDLITCTGNAINHLPDPDHIEKVFQNAYQCLNEGGYYVLDFLNESEISPGDPFDFPVGDHVNAQFWVTLESNAIVHLRTKIFEKGILSLEEDIAERIYAPGIFQDLLKKCGFTLIKIDHTLLDQKETKSSTWYAIAKKAAKIIPSAS